ncbi:MAG: extracellular solute-binding protein, partial [Solirubrobacterales bacterium]
MAALAATLVLAACGGGEDVGGASENEAQTAEPGPVEGELNFSNWVGYIDKGENGTVADFEAKYPGVTLNYTEDVNDNNEFFGIVRNQLASCESTGRDMFVLTDWMAARVQALGWLQKLDMDRMPNVEANLVDNLRSPSWDENREYSVPWQSGLTGIAYNADLVDEVRTFDELLT